MLFILIYNKFYFTLKNKIIFTNYFVNFLLFSIILFIVIFLFAIKIAPPVTFKNIWLDKSDILTSLFYIYIYTFISFFLTIGLKSIPSPSEQIFEIIKKSTKLDNIYIKLKNKKILKIRIKDLIYQNLIYKKNKKIILTNYGKVFAKKFLVLQKLLKIKIEG